MSEIINLFAITSTLTLIILAEIGDKTQILTLTLAATTQSSYQVLIGATLAESFVSLLGIAIGTTIAEIIPVETVSKVAGFVFIIFGTISIMRNKSEDLAEKKNNVVGIKGTLKVFSIIAAAELGDKTQLAVIALAAEHNSPFSVALGVIAGFTILSIIGVLLGQKISRIIPISIIQKTAALSFIVIGLILILGIL